MIPCTVAHEAPLSVGLSRQECWSGLPCPSPGDLPTQGLNPGFLFGRWVLIQQRRLFRGSGKFTSSDSWVPGLCPYISAPSVSSGGCPQFSQPDHPRIVPGPPRPNSHSHCSVGLRFGVLELHCICGSRRLQQMSEIATAESRMTVSAFALPSLESLAAQGGSGEVEAQGVDRML